MKPFPLTLSALMLASCGTVRPITATDSTRVEVRTETVTVHDTAYIQIPAIVERIQTLDTCSVIENKYAKSEASITEGILAHSLEIKPVREPVEVEKQIVYRDSLVYVDRVLSETVEVEKQLTWWESLKMKTGGVTLIAIAIAILYFMFNLLNLKKP